MLELRTLSPSGIGKFSEYLDNLAGSPKENPPFSLLTESGFTEAVPGNLLIDQSKRFYSKMAAAEYLSDIVGKIDATLTAAGRRTKRCGISFPISKAKSIGGVIIGICLLDPMRFTVFIKKMEDFCLKVL